MIAELKHRGIKIAPPARVESLDRLRGNVSEEIFIALRDHIYSIFDGFEGDDFDENSFLRIWPIKRILENINKFDGIVPFIDFSLDSEIYGLTSQSSEEIFGFHSKKFTGIELSVLVEKLINGDFDGALGL